jgi:hypothetical protein
MCGTAGSKPPADLFGGTELTASEGTGTGDSVAWAAICRSLCLEYGHDPLSAATTRGSASLGFFPRLGAEKDRLRRQDRAIDERWKPRNNGV